MHESPHVDARRLNLTRSVPNQRVTAPAISLCTFTVVALLALPGPSLAQAPGARCRSVRTDPAAGAPHACTQSAYAPGSAHGSRARPRHTATGRHAGHAVKRATARRHAAHRPSTRVRAGSSPATRLIPALCEDGTRPAYAGGRFSCDDGSEPACEDGSYPIASRDGSHLVCEPPPSGSVGEAVCEDGSRPLSVGEGSFSCDDGSEPACEDGTQPTLSSNRARPVCDLVPAGPGFESAG